MAVIKIADSIFPSAPITKSEKLELIHILMSSMYVTWMVEKSEIVVADGCDTSTIP
jgi:hypothetical protein